MGWWSNSRWRWARLRRRAWTSSSARHSPGSPPSPRPWQDQAFRLAPRRWHRSIVAASPARCLRPLLRGLCSYALIGHYERRIQCSESNGDIRKRIVAALDHDIRPICCVGEAAEALEDGMTSAVLTEQLEAVLDGLDLDARLVIAYAPIWTTIGMIIPPEAAFVNSICSMIRETLADIASPDLAAQTRIIYGGRLTESNVQDLAAQPEIDGLLVGAGAASPERFAMMARAVLRAPGPQLPNPI